MRAGYFLRETAGNLWRNITITFASVLTVAVTFALVGSGVMVRSGVENATSRWEAGIEFVVFMNAEATAEEIAALDAELSASPGVTSHSYFDADATYVEFQRLFEDQPEMIEAVTPDILPTSFRVEPESKEARSIKELGNLFQDKPGVRDVVFASDTIEAVQGLARKVNRIILFAAFVLGVAATLLIFITVQMAVYARRREIEVQKLVGATNWFIRIPFMLEGLIQGVLGALVAAISIYSIERFVLEGLFPRDLELVSGFAVSNSEMGMIYLVVMVGGSLLGAVAAGIAVTWFVDV